MNDALATAASDPPLTAPESTRPSAKAPLTVSRVEDVAAHRASLTVLHEVYRTEKGWLDDPETFFPVSDLERSGVSWFLARRGERPVGLVRVLYEIPFDLYDDYGFELADAAFDVDAFVRENQIAEIGRFAVLGEERRHFRVAAILMRAAAAETVERGFSHYITDVFESDPNNPYRFHHDILGFRVVATHDEGELTIDSRRLTMLLDIREAYERHKAKRSWVFRNLMVGWHDGLFESSSESDAKPDTEGLTDSASDGLRAAG